ncbi:MAG: hypothetical protein GX764_00005 [Firmicutes bacterium]|nr:hypothetical protein [Bacillota bacterium]
MADSQELCRLPKNIDGKGYKEYKSIRGEYRFPKGTLYIDHVQGDPFAAPSCLRYRVEAEKAQFPEQLYRTRVRRVALQDFLTRQFAQSLEAVVQGNRGSGKSGLIEIDQCGQEIL